LREIYHDAKKEKILAGREGVERSWGLAITAVPHGTGEMSASLG